MTVTFNAPVTLATGSNPNDVAIGDFNGDGNLDLVTANGNPLNSSTNGEKSSISVLLGNGSGSFNETRFSIPVSSFGGVAEVRSIAVGDFNGDGKQDLVAATFKGNQKNISVLLGNGTGSFSAAIDTTFSSDNGLLDQAVGDFNKDGKSDLAIVTSRAGLHSISVLLAAGTGGLQPAIEVSSGIDRVEAIVTGDFNGDGQLDLGASGTSARSSSSNDRAFSILLGNGTGQFNLAATTLGDLRAISSKGAAADLNGDGKLDFTFDGSVTLLGDGLGGLRKPNLTFYSYSGGSAVADFNGDGRLDLVSKEGRSGDYYNYSSGPVSVLLGNNTGEFSRPTLIAAGGSSTNERVIVGDFNKDGKPDLAVIYRSGSSLSTTKSTTNVSILLNTTSETDSIVFTNYGLVDSSIEASSINVDLSKGRFTLNSSPAITKDTRGYQDVFGTIKDDVITGSRDRNLLDGNAGNDTISGLNGDDTIIGNFGKDTLTGGKGKDLFAFGGAGSFSRSLGVDRITDFTKTQDIIALEPATFTTLKKKISFASVETTAEAKTSTAQITYIAAKGILFYNQNGKAGGFGQGGKFADLDDNVVLTTKDFKLTAFYSSVF